MIWVMLMTAFSAFGGGPMAHLETNVDRIFVKESTPVVFKLILNHWTATLPQEISLDQIDESGKTVKTTATLKLEPNPLNEGQPLYAARAQINIRRPTVLRFRAKIVTGRNEESFMATIDGLGRPSMVELIQDVWHRISIWRSASR